MHKLQKSTKMSTLTKKIIITNSAQRELATLVNFQGCYVTSLIKAAKRTLEGSTVHELLLAARAAARAAEKRAAEDLGFKTVKDYRTALEKGRALLNDPYLFDAGTSMGEIRRITIGGKILIQTKRYCREYAKSGKWRADHPVVILKFAHPTQFLRMDGYEGNYCTNFRGVEYIVVKTGKKHSTELRVCAV
jgi:hypothetical protein